MKIYVDASARCDGDGSEFRPFKRELMKRQRLRLQEMKS